LDATLVTVTGAGLGAAPPQALSTSATHTACILRIIIAAHRSTAAKILAGFPQEDATCLPSARSRWGHRPHAPPGGSFDLPGGAL